MVPQGYAKHPSAPGWVYELANPNNMMQEPPDLAPTPPPPPAAPAAPALPGYAPQAGYAQPAQPSYGTADSSLVDEEIGHLNSFGRGDTLWLDFVQMKTAPVNTEDSMTLRFMPPWTAQEKLPYLTTTQHELLPGMVPDSKQKYPKVDCFNNDGGPGQCDACQEIEDMLASGQLSEDDSKSLRKMEAKLKIRWQAVRMDKPDAHWQQVKNDAGHPILDANGQPQWKFVPGVFSVKPKLQKKLLFLWQQRGDLTAPEHGYPVRIKKQKTGPGDFDVEYFETGLDKEPLAQDYRGALDNLIDLRKLLYFKDRGVMQQIAANIRAKFQPQQRTAYVPPPVSRPPTLPGAAPPPPPPAPPAQWFQHPDNPAMEYNAAGQMRPKAAAPLAAPPPPPAPAVAPGPPPPAPAHLPPAAAPGMHNGRPVGPAVPPPPPAPAFVPPPPPPPVSDGGPWYPHPDNPTIEYNAAGQTRTRQASPGMGGVVSAQQLEQQLAATSRGDAPPF